MADPAGGLVPVATYQRVTNDTASEAPASALNDALELVQDYLSRTLPSGTYTETLYVARNRVCYPSAVPIQSVSSPQVAGVSIQGAGVYVGYFDPTPVVSLGDWSAAIPPQVTVTYTGGYTASTLPVRLRNALCRVAFNLLHPVALTNIPAGANSVHVADVGYSGQTLRAFDPLDDAVRRDLKGYRRPQVRGWQT